MDETKSVTPKTEIARIPPSAHRTFSLMPSSLGEAMEIAKLIAESDFAPKDYRSKPGNVMIAIQMGADVGLKPMQALQGIAVINGRPSIWGDAALALVQSSDVLERFHETIEGEGDKRTATCIVKRKGLPDEIKRTFSVADAKLAKLWGKTGQNGHPTPWVTYPDRMLQMRARGFALRDAASDRLMGLVLAEEAMDYPDAIDVQATTVTEIVNPLEKVSEGRQVSINKAFEMMNISPGLRLAKVNEFLGREGVDPQAGADALIEWCKDEYAKRQGKERAKASNNKPVVESKEPAKPAPEPKPEVKPDVPKGESVKASEIPFASGGSDLGF